MARHLTERELRKIERQRRKEDEEERRMLQELEDELKERREHELRELKAQQERIRKAKREQIERKKRELEKQKQKDEIEEIKRSREELQQRENLKKEMRLKLMEEIIETEHCKQDMKEKENLKEKIKVLRGKSNSMEKSFIPNKDSDRDIIQNRDEQEIECNESYIDGDRNDESYEDSESNDSLYSVIDELNDTNNETCFDMGTPIDASSYIDESKEKVKTLEREMHWLDEKAKEHEELLMKDIDRNKRSVAERNRSLQYSSREYEYKRSGKTQCVERKVKDRSLLKHLEDDVRDLDESEEERELLKDIETLQKEKRKVQLEIERNKLLKDIQREEIEKQKLEMMKEQRETERKRDDKLQKLIKEKEKLANDLNKEKKALDEMKKETESERKKVEEKERIGKKGKETSVEKQDYLKGKLLKPNIPKLTENTFDEWKVEVEVIMNSGLYDESLLRQAVRNSLSGQTRKILLTIPSSTTTKQIIEKLENVYGNVRSGESALAEFYLAKQRKDEGISEWGIRLESIIQTAIDKGHVKEEQKDEMIKTRFWRQLYDDELKNATRMYFETAKTFEELRRKVRVEENEIKNSREDYFGEETIQTNRQTENREETTVMEDLVERMRRLETEIKTAKSGGNEDGNRRRTYREYDDKEYNTDRGRQNYRDRYRRVHDDYRQGSERNWRQDNNRYNKDNGRRDMDRYDRKHERDKRPSDYKNRRDEDRFYRDYSRGRHYENRYEGYRERRRYSPRDRRNDRRDYTDKEKEDKYYRDYRNNRDTREEKEREHTQISEDRDRDRTYRKGTDNRDTQDRHMQQTQRTGENKGRDNVLNRRTSPSEGR